jgi:hypothetical protein
MIKQHLTNHGKTYRSVMKKNNPPAVPERLALKNAIGRCHDPRHQAYKNYGARGITVCDEWRSSFMAFYEHIGPKPSPDLDLDRLDNSKGYCPGNVRWATRQQNTRNRRKCGPAYQMAKNMGYSCVTEAAETIGISNALFAYRARSGMPIELMAARPNSDLINVRKRKKHAEHNKHRTSSGDTVPEACAKSGVLTSCAYKRISAYGWDVDAACGVK